MELSKIDEVGQKYYDHVPEGFRQAVMDDYNKGLFKNNTPYLLYGYHTGVYYSWRVHVMLHPAVIEFIKDGSVYIYTG